MLIGHSRRSGGFPRRTLITTAAVCLVPLAALASASPAVAAPVFEKFANCPTEIPIVYLCQTGTITGGEVTIGSARMPIDQPITLQAGLIKTGNPENEREFFLVPGKNGESLSKTELNVPGGLFGPSNCDEIRGGSFFRRGAQELCRRFFDNRFTRVTATVESAANEHNPPILNEYNFGSEQGSALTLPTKIHLKNPLLGNGCYIGSESNPIELQLSSGTSGKLKGKFGEPETVIEVVKEEKLRSLRDTGISLVDNTFTVPAAEGCGEIFGVTGFLDPLLDRKLGLPSGTGKNAVKLELELNLAPAETVIAGGF